MKKINKKRTIFTVLFCLIIAVFGGVVASVKLFKAMDYQGHEYSSDYHNIDNIVSIKIGEKISWLETLDEDDKIEATVWNRRGYNLVHEQSVKNVVRLDSLDDETLTEKTHSRAVYIDEEGYICATQTGVYQLNFTIRSFYGSRIGKNHYYYKDVDSFYFIVAVYESDESKYLPFDRNLNEKANFDPTASYIITENMEISGELAKALCEHEFTGVLINPKDYTLTLKKGAYTLQSLFGVNRGIIDGVRLKIERGEEETAYLDDVSLFVKDNYGMIIDCYIQGTVMMIPNNSIYAAYDPTNTANKSGSITIFPLTGFMMNNIADLTIYTDGRVDAYDGSLRYLESNAKFWITENNKIIYDCYYYTDRMQCRTRNIDDNSHRSWHEVEDSNTCIRRGGKPYYNDSRKITLRIPKKNGEYREQEITASLNSVMEIETGWWDIILNPYQEARAQYAKVEYWLVNGEKWESLDNFVHTSYRDLTIEPCVKYYMTGEEYVDTGYTRYLSQIYNADEKLIIGENQWQIKLTYNFFYNFFNDPRNVIPEEIVFSADVIEQHNDFFGRNSLQALAAWIKEGNGERKISGTIILKDQMLYSDDGKILYCYFPSEGQTEIVLPSHIKEISQDAFILCDGIKSLDLTQLEQVDENFDDYICNSQIESLKVNSVLFSNGQLKLLKKNTSIKEIYIIGDYIKLMYNSIRGCIGLEKLYIHATNGEATIGKGVFNINLYEELIENVEVYLNVGEQCVWEGVVPNTLKIYVPNELVSHFKSKWSLDENQIFGYDFTLSE